MGEDEETGTAEAEPLQEVEALLEQGREEEALTRIDEAFPLLWRDAKRLAGGLPSWTRWEPVFREKLRAPILGGDRSPGVHESAPADHLMLWLLDEGDLDEAWEVGITWGAGWFWWEQLAVRLEAVDPLQAARAYLVLLDHPSPNRAQAPVYEQRARELLRRASNSHSFEPLREEVRALLRRE